MAQTSGPRATGTLAERQFTDVLWRDLFGAEAGVIGDLDGTAYAVSLPTDSDIAQVGSATQASLALVAGFRHRIDAGSTEPVTIPAAVGSTRTDIIALRYDPAYTGDPGPVRLVRVAGTSAGIPAADDSPPGVEELPLWAVTRQPGQALSQATVKRLFPRLAPNLELPAGAPLPTSSPLGTIVRPGTRTYRRELGTAGAPVWTPAGALIPGGSSGAMAGAPAPADAPRIFKTFAGTINLNANGDGTWVFPDGPFPNGLLHVDQPAHYSPSGPPSNDIEFKVWNPSLSKLSIRCYFADRTFGNTGVAVTMLAIGW